jgi:hypothetical protein
MVKDGWREGSGDTPPGVCTENIVFCEVFNSLTAMVADLRPLFFFDLRGKLLCQFLSPQPAKGNAD